MPKVQFFPQQDIFAGEREKKRRFLLEKRPDSCYILFNGDHSDKNAKEMLSILRNFLLCIIGLAAAFCCWGEAFTALEDEDAGQLVYRRRDSSVYVFKKRAGKLWEGVLFKGEAR